MALVVILLLFVGYWLALYGQAFKHREEMRDYLRLLVIADLTGSHQKEMEALVKAETWSRSDQERLKYLAELSRTEVTSLEMRGLWLHDIVFRVTYRTGVKDALEETAFYVVAYSFLRGWCLEETYLFPEICWTLAPLRMFH